MARAPADGYTLLIGTSATHGTSPSTYANLPYSATGSFEPIAAVASSPLLVVVNPLVPGAGRQNLISAPEKPTRARNPMRPPALAARCT